MLFRSAIPQNVDPSPRGQDQAGQHFQRGGLSRPVQADQAGYRPPGDLEGKVVDRALKRHGFSGVVASHGAHRNHRKPGSIGACATPGRIFKGLRMAGRMGHAKRTVQNLKVRGVDVDKGVLLVNGAIPGPKGSVVVVRTAVKGA